MKSDSYLPLAIVLVVGVAAIGLMAVSSDSSSEENLVGEAYRYSTTGVSVSDTTSTTKVNTQVRAPTPTLPSTTSREGCTDTDGHLGLASILNSGSTTIHWTSAADSSIQTSVRYDYCGAPDGQGNSKLLYEASCVTDASGKKRAKYTKFFCATICNPSDDGAFCI